MIGLERRSCEPADDVTGSRPQGLEDVAAFAEPFSLLTRLQCFVLRHVWCDGSPDVTLSETLEEPKVP